jgi:hypothetical protein
MACVGVGYAIFITARHEFAGVRARNGLRAFKSYDVVDTHSHARDVEFKAVTFLSVGELRGMMDVSPGLLILEVHESFTVPRDSSAVPGALCISLYRLRELLAWVPQNEVVILYGIGVSPESLIRFVSAQFYRLKVSILRTLEGPFRRSTCTIQFAYSQSVRTKAS